MTVNLKFNQPLLSLFKRFYLILIFNSRKKKNLKTRVDTKASEMLYRRKENVVVINRYINKLTSEWYIQMYNTRGMKGKREWQVCQKKFIKSKCKKIYKLTVKNPGGIGPPGGMPSFGGICPSGEGAGPVFCKYIQCVGQDFKIFCWN